MPREHERHKRLCFAARGLLRDRRPGRGRQLLTVVPLRFDRSRIQALLELAGARLTGEWLLVGGAAAAAWFASVRTTDDIVERRAQLREVLGEAAP